MPTEPRRLLSNAAIATIGTGVSSLLAVAYVSIGARWLGPREYAIVGATVAIANVLSLALNPLETGIALRAANIEGREGTKGLRAYCARSFRGLLLLSAVIFAAWYAAVPTLASYTGHDIGALRWLGLFFCASVAMCVPRGVLRGRERFFSFTINVAVESATRLALGLALIHVSGDAAAMVAGYALSVCVALVVASYQMVSGLPKVDEAPRSLSWRDAIEPVGVLSAPLMGIDLYVALVMNADVITAERYLDAHEAGLYAGGAQVARMVLIGAMPLVTVLVSRLAALSAAREDTSSTMWQGSALVLGALLSSLLVPFFFGGLVLRLLMGDAYVDAEPLLRIQWATACVLTLQSFFGLSVLATGATRGGLMFLFPATALLWGLLRWHATAAQIAWVGLISCSVFGTVTFYSLWRLRGRPSPRSTAPSMPDPTTAREH